MSGVLGRPPEPFKGESSDFAVWLSEFEDYVSVVQITTSLSDEQKLSLVKIVLGQ